MLAFSGHPTITMLSDAARKAFEAMDAAQYEFKSDFAKRYLAEGRTEGEARIVLRLIARKFGPVPEGLEERVRHASSEELERWAEAMLTAETLEDVFQS